jgi:Zn-dependent peptidase ImmA (M78 family)/DNA-binding XRE family transcriptional regulator
MECQNNRASPELVLGERLRQARGLAGFSQGEAAQKLGVTSAALSQYEGGKRRMEVLMLDRIASLYGIPVTYFFAAINNAEIRVADAAWETNLRIMARALSPDGKAGVSRLIQQIYQLEELYQVTRTNFPVSAESPLHHPFPALGESKISDYEVAEYTRKVRRYFNLGVAPMLNIKNFLDTKGYQVFAIPLGQDEGSLSGLFFSHPKLGAIIVFNEMQAYSRFPFTLSHEIAHSFFHWDRSAILCRIDSHESDPQENFADRFASYFLIPQEGLQELLQTMDIKTVKYPEEVVHIARYFGVSYRATVYRLEADRKLGASKEKFKGVKPVALAKSLGYSPLPYEFGVRPLPPEERLPRIFLELSYKALNERLFSLRRVAEILGISDIELEDRLYGESVEDSEEAYV